MNVIAGGGLVWDGAHLLVVHRPRYDDWTLPKGKLDREDGGDVLACAVREVWEETGTTVAAGPPAGRTRYRVGVRGGGSGVKVVDYWHMRRTGGSFRPNREVDVVRWVAVADAQRILTFERDRALIAGVEPCSTPDTNVLGRYGHAVATGDGDGLEAVLADDAVVVGRDGTRLPREELIAAVVTESDSGSGLGRGCDPARTVVRDARIVELHLV